MSAPQEAAGTPAAVAEPIVRLEHVSRIYRSGAREVHALRDLSLSLAAGTLVALRGISGSGKTTLLNVIGGLDRPNSGEIWLEGRAVSRLSGRDWVRLRRQRIGFIFQSFALMPTYSAAENVDLMLRLAGYDRARRRGRTAEVLALVGLRDWADHRPFEMSGGQQQRVAIARAIAPRPALLLADEPTGELDTATGEQILRLLRRIVDEEGTTILVATHDLAVDAFADRVIHLVDGQIAPEGV